jgi:hypothetical protein
MGGVGEGLGGGGGYAAEVGGRTEDGGGRG